MQSSSSEIQMKNLRNTVCRKREMLTYWCVQTLKDARKGSELTQSLKYSIYSCPPPTSPICINSNERQDATNRKRKSWSLLLKAGSNFDYLGLVLTLFASYNKTQNSTLWTCTSDPWFLCWDCVLVFSTECYAHRDKCIPTEGIGNPWVNFCIMQSPLLYLSRLSARAYRVHISGWQEACWSIIVSFARMLKW